MNDTGLIQIYQIDDGATHWVAARSSTDAINIYAKSFCNDIVTYIDECCDGEMPEVELYLKDTLEVDVSQDDMEILSDYPPRCVLKVIIPKSEYGEFEPGLICTTEY